MSHPTPSKPVIIAKSSQLKTSGGQSTGMIRQSALIDLCPGICATRMIAHPHTSSGIHHHGEQDTIVFSVRGKGSVISEGGKKRVDIEAGDFVLIPAWMEHQEVNDGEEEVVWAIVRSGRVPEVVNLDGWGGKVAEG